MNIMMDLNTVLSGVAVLGIGFIFKTIWKIEKRVTTIETICRIKNHCNHETNED